MWGGEGVGKPWRHNTSLCFPLTHTQTNIPIFKEKESSVRRRYRDFEWLKKELERDSKVSVLDHWRCTRVTCFHL